MTRKRRSFSPEFKQEAASLVLDQGYTIAQACTSLGGTSRDRHLLKERKTTPSNAQQYLAGRQNGYFVKIRGRVRLPFVGGCVAEKSTNLRQLITSGDNTTKRL